MLWSRVILVLSLTVVSVRPELSLEEIEKELEQLSAKEHDAAAATKTETSSTSTESDTEKAQSGLPKELLDKSHETPKEELKALEQSVADTETKIDEAEKKTTHDSTKPVASDAPKPVTPAPMELPHRDISNGARSSLLQRLVPRPRFVDTPAYRRILEAEALNRRPDFFPNPAPRGYYSYDQSAPLPKPYWKEAPVRDSPWMESPYRNTGVADMTRAERMALSAGSWVGGNEPVRVPAKIPLPPLPAVDARSFDRVHQQMDDESIDDLIRGKSGLTQTEIRRRYLLDLLAEKLKKKVNEAQKRGIKVPDKIMDYLWNYESHRSINAQPARDGMMV